MNSRPELVTYEVTDWCVFTNTDRVFIDPGLRWKNGRLESFNGWFRDEFIKGRSFDDLLKGRVIV